MSKAPWFKFWAADYLASPFVQSLEPEQEFWYLRLIIASALANPRGCLPFATSKLYLLARAKSQEHFEKHSSEILAKFERDETRGLYIVGKIANQLIALDDISKKRAEAGKKGGLAKQQKRALAIATNLPQQLLTESDSDSDKREGKKTSRSSQMPEGFKPSDSHWALAGELRVELKTAFESFRDFHLSKGSTFKDWDRALNTWIRKEREFSRTAVRGKGAPENVPDTQISQSVLIIRAREERRAAQERAQ
jgi:hypothetical protein